MDAAEALSIGLVNRIVPKDKLMKCASDLARRIAEKSPVAVRLGKLYYYTSADMTFEQGMAYAREMLSINAKAEDFKEGLQAFFEKRAPIWSGR
jgi:enoyl-CoA hydratase/carnithine racemase